MTTAIPHTELSRITQTKSSPETIAALLNEAEAIYSQKPKHSWAKRVYPFWKICEVCSKPYPCQTKEQATRKKTCSKSCMRSQIGAKNKGERKPRPKCKTCGKVFQPKSATALSKALFCSKECYGVHRSQSEEIRIHLKEISSKGRAGWTETSRKSYQQKMSGENNPAWKGGVTYFRKRGNYKPIKYVKCPQEFMPMARKDGYVMEHRLLVAKAIGRCLTRVEVVHHKNHDPQDNRLENLELFANNKDHKLYEHHGSPEPIWRP